MFKISKHTTNVVLAISSIIILPLIAFVVIKFFTDDKFFKDTIDTTSISNFEEKEIYEISTQENDVLNVIASNEEVTPNTSDIEKDEQKNTNEIQESNITENSTKVSTTTSRDGESHSSSRSSTERTSPKANTETSTSSVSQTKQTEQPEQNQTQVSNVSTNTDSIGTITIPKTGVNLPILKKVTVSGMETAVCFLFSTGSLNKSGTTIIVGHNYRNNKLFSNNKNLQIGDIINITTLDGNQVQYTVYDKIITTDDDLSYLSKNTTGEAQIALSTCTDDDVNRLVILAK